MSIIGLGTDITEISRITGMLERHGEHFVTRVFTTGEQSYCATKKEAGQHYAGRWAAKEAVMKALGTGWSATVGWTDIEVRLLVSGKPVIALSGGAEAIASKLGITEVLISISHCKEYAMATAIAISGQ
jgi:holo-[acyl-carrier protein] synthase